MRQLWALLLAATRELTRGLPAVAGELRAWRMRALTIPDRPLRDDALHSLSRKRANTDGAALFSILAARHDRHLVSLIAAYETIWDFLDNISERGASAGEDNGLLIHRALREALDLDAARSDYYCQNPWKDDGGYLQALVGRCRECCLLLPSYRSVREVLTQEARRSEVGVYNHELDREGRENSLRRWAAREFPQLDEPSWFELTAAASCSAVVHVLLVLAARAECEQQELERVYAAYFPWFSIAVTMLDSYVDRAEDLAEGAHSYIAYYQEEEVAAQRLCQAVELSVSSLCSLRLAPRHAVIAACMVAMYLSKDSARVPEMRATSARIARAGGSLTRLLLPILRLWRVAYGQQSA